MHQKAVTVQQRHETGRTAGPLSARSSGVPKAASASFTVHHRFNDVAVYPQDTKDSLCPLPAPRSCPFGGACHACPIRIHASLKAGRSESSGEREARRIADDVMNRSDAFEKMPLDGGQQNRPHRKAGDSGSEGLAVSPAAEAEIHSLGAGRALPDALRSFFEPRFGYDLGFLRIHTDEQAVRAANAVGARAFCLGRDLVFGDGAFSPASREGKTLLAHEIAHALEDGPAQATTLQCTYTCNSWTPVDDARTQRIIDEAMAFSGNDVSGALGHVIAQRNSCQANCCDLNYAAADHYFVAREMTADGSPLLVVLALIYGYALIPSEVIPETGICPVSPCDSDVNAWAVTGAWDGRVDWEAAHPMRGGREDLDVPTYTGFGAFK